MASSVVTYQGVPMRGAAHAKKRAGLSSGGLSALLGGGILASVCAVAAFASLHGMAQASHGTQRFDKMLLAQLDRPVGEAPGDVQPTIHVHKFSRLSANPEGHQKMTRLAAEHHLNAKLFAARFGTAAAIDAQGQATVKELAALRPSAIVDSALGRGPETAMLETQEAKEHPAFEAALGRPQAKADEEIDLLPETVPLPNFRPEIAKAFEVEPTPRPASPSVVEKEIAAQATVPTPAKPPVQQPATSTMVAFARPDNPMRQTKMDAVVPWPDRGNGTAIYDISAGVVHLPSGEKLEAHSGIGKMRDNPDFVHVKMRGATPPSSYRLTMRESLFHGVEAIRLTPESGVNPHGRNGLLAHTYMLAKRGESNGCVVFKEYPKFLAAFKRGEVKRLIVVPKLNGRPSAVAASSGGKSGGKTLFGSLFGKG